MSFCPASLFFELARALLSLAATGLHGYFYTFADSFIFNKLESVTMETHT